jgi:prepilin-type N-terminal cleavage/methylation domain-containing protein
MKGFTLIELLVVISIISLFLAISILGVLHYRDRARDVRVESSLTQTKAVATMINNDTDSFRRICDEGNNTINDSDSDYSSLRIIENDVKAFNNNRDVKCYASDMAFCVSSPLSAESYCVDFTGYSGREKTICDTSVICH